MQVNHNIKTSNGWMGTGTGESSVTVARLARYINEARDKNNTLKNYGKYYKRGNDIYLTSHDGLGRDIYMLTDAELAELLPLIK